jgi:hypothetical protein
LLIRDKNQRQRLAPKINEAIVYSFILTNNFLMEGTLVSSKKSQVKEFHIHFPPLVSPDMEKLSINIQASHKVSSFLVHTV